MEVRGGLEEETICKEKPQPPEPVLTNYWKHEQKASITTSSAFFTSFKPNEIHRVETEEKSVPTEFQDYLK